MASDKRFNARAKDSMDSHFLTPSVSLFNNNNSRLHFSKRFSILVEYGLIVFFKARKSSFIRTAEYISLPRSTKLCASSIKKMPLPETPSPKKRFRYT